MYQAIADVVRHKYQPEPDKATNCPMPGQIFYSVLVVVNPNHEIEQSDNQHARHKHYVFNAIQHDRMNVKIDVNHRQQRAE
jgi:hypothetical protein